MSPAAPKNPGDAAPPATSPSSYSGTQATSDNGRSAAPPAFDPAGAGSKTASGAGSTGFGSQAGADPVAPAATHVGVTRTPPERRAGLAPYSEDESLEELAARRLELKKLADDMHQKAAEAAQKAKSLR
jgi:hypothetical protein